MFLLRIIKFLLIINIIISPVKKKVFNLVGSSHFTHERRHSPKLKDYIKLGVMKSENAIMLLKRKLLTKVVSLPTCFVKLKNYIGKILLL